MSAQTHITTDVKVNDAGASANLSKIGIASKRAGQQMDFYTTALDKSSKQAKKANGAFRLMRGGLGQVGHQIQDVSVQLQMGTNAMIVLGQQGSQVVSLFGGGGAVIGAFISVGAAIYTYLNASSVEAQKAINGMKDEMSDTALKATEMSDAMRNLAIAQTQKNIEKYKAQIEELKNSNEGNKSSIDKSTQANKLFNQQIGSSANAMGNMSTSANGAGLAYLLLGGEANKAKNEVLGFGGQLEITTAKLNEQEENLDKLKKGKVLVQTESEKLIKAMQKEVSILQRQVTLNLDASLAQALYNAEVKNATPEELEHIRALYKKQKALQDNLEQQEQAKVKAQELKTADEARKSSIEKIISSLASQTSQLNLQASGLYTATEAQLLHTLASKDATAEQIANALAIQKQNDALKEQIQLKNGSPNKSTDNKDGDFGDFYAEQEAIDKKLQQTRDYFKSDADLFNEFYSSKNDMLSDALEMERITQAEHDQLVLALEKDKTDKIKAMQQNVTQQTAQMLASDLSNLASYFDESSKIGKAFYVIQQGMAGADAIIKGYQSASAIQVAYANAAALMTDPTGASQTAMIAQGATMGKVAIGIGYATAGAIAGQTLASFEGGGITFNGVRSGGIDGKGGRMAVVHPNEKITDLEKGGSMGQPVSVSFNINAVDAKGIDQLLYERRGQITAMVQKAVNNVGRRIM